MLALLAKIQNKQYRYQKSSKRLPGNSPGGPLARGQVPSQIREYEPHGVDKKKKKNNSQKIL